MNYGETNEKTEESADSKPEQVQDEDLPMDPEEENVAPEAPVESQIFTSMPPPPPGTERQDLTTVKSWDDTSRGRKFGAPAPNSELISPSKPGESGALSSPRRVEEKKKRGSMDHETNVSSGDDEDAMVVDSLGIDKDDSLGDSSGAAAPDETPEERKKRLKRDKRFRKKLTDAKQKGKKELTKAIENMGLENPRAPGADTPGAISSISIKSAKSSSRTTRTNSSGMVVKPEKVAKPLFKEVSRFSMAMADGMWLLTDRCCKNDPHPSEEEVISAWEEVWGTGDQGQSLPSLLAISTFGSECALKFAFANEAFLGNGTKIPNLAAEDPARHSLECRYNSTGRTSVYNVRSTSLVSRDGVVAALRAHYPRDKIRLYQAHLKGVKLDNWALKFEKPPQTTTGQLSFPGTEVAGRGPWKSLVVAAGENCVYCGQSVHGENLGECRSLSFVQFVEPGPINYL